jgi:hypothetical protein
MFGYGFFDNQQPVNAHAQIVTRTDARGNLRTETQRREDGLSIAASTNSSDATKVYIDLPEGDSLQLSGHAARTLYRVLQKHFQNSGKSY